MWPSFKSFIAVNRYDRGRLTQLRLYHLDLGLAVVPPIGALRVSLRPALGREMLENLQTVIGALRHHRQS